MKRFAGLAIALIVALAAVARADRPIVGEVETEQQADLSPKECDTDGDDDNDGDDWASEVQLQAASMRLFVLQHAEAGVSAQWHREEIGFPPWSVA